MISNSTTSKYSISMDTINCNTEFVKTHLFKQMRNSLNIANELIDKEMNGISILIKPIVQSYYTHIVKREMEIGSKKTINGMLNICKKIVHEDIKVNSGSFNIILKEKFPLYLKNDQTGRQCRHSHKNFSRLKKNLRNTFYSQIIGILPLLKVPEKVNNYYELCRLAFDTADECKHYLKLQTDSMLKGQNIIKEDLSILNIPSNAARKMIFKVLRKGFDLKIKEFNEAIDTIYEHYN